MKKQRKYSYLKTKLDRITYNCFNNYIAGVKKITKGAFGKCKNKIQNKNGDEKK
jgi:hypothetical protein